LFTMSSAAPIVTLSLSGLLHYLDPSTSKPVRLVSGHQKTVKALDITTDDSTLFTASYDGRVCAWDGTSGHAEVVSETEGNIVQIAASKTSAWSVSSADVLKKIEVEKLTYEYFISRIILTAEDQRLA
jgi:WD repeat-containing protein 1 (actin-interacting protein 1)